MRKPIWLTGMAANPEVVRKVMEHTVAAYEEYVSTHNVAYVDGYMAGHNIHKAILLELIERAAESPEHRRALLIAARDTWAEMIERELKKAGN